MRKSLAISIQPASNLKLEPFDIAAISVAISMLIFSRFRGDSVAICADDFKSLQSYCHLKSLRLRFYDLGI